VEKIVLIIDLRVDGCYYDIVCDAGFDWTLRSSSW